MFIPVVTESKPLHNVIKQKDEKNLKLLLFHKVCSSVKEIPVSRHYEYQIFTHIPKTIVLPGEEVLIRGSSTQPVAQRVPKEQPSRQRRGIGAVLLPSGFIIMLPC